MCGGAPLDYNAKATKLGENNNIFTSYFFNGKKP
jgi:hypothetical protein